jgi:hypothetical protein
MRAGDSAAEAVDDVGGLRRMLEQELPVDSVEREIASELFHGL